MTRLLDNRYQVLHSLAEGGFGATFLAEDTRTPSRRRCVVKQLKPIATNSELQDVVKQRFTREAAVLEELGHDHRQIPLLYAYFEENKEYYLVQEYVQGETLTQRVDRHGVWNEEQARKLLKQMLPVLIYIHDRGIIHRDIKPDNIILRQSDGIPALIDFGAVKEAMHTSAAVAGQTPKSIVIGTAGFMAPEQAVGRPMFSSDLYALALTVIYCLTGRLPHLLETHPSTGEINWQQFAPKLSSEIASVLTKAISPNPQTRYSTAQAMLKALDESHIAPARSVEEASPTIAVAPGKPPMPATATAATQVARTPEPPSPPAVSSQPAPRPTVPVQTQKSRWPLVLMWLGAAAVTSGIVFAVMTQTQLPKLLPGNAPPAVMSLTPEIAAMTVRQFYQHLSARSWDKAKSVTADSLAAQFNPSFFQQFQRITVDDLQYLSKSANRVELVGRNIYYYPDGSTQEERRTYRIDLIDGRPRITASDFKKVLKPRR